MPGRGRGVAAAVALGAALGLAALAPTPGATSATDATAARDGPAADAAGASGRTAEPGPRAPGAVGLPALAPSPTSAATPEPPVPAPPPAPPPPRSVSIVATGDVLLHERLWRQAADDAAAAGQPGLDFAPMLAAIAPHVSGADLAVCHLEVPLAPEGGPYQGYPLFAGPPQVVPALAATGYDACTTASNHTFDQGAAGVDRTLATLDGAGLRHAGSARTPEEAAATTLVDVGDAGATVRVALLSATYGFNGIPYPDGQTWRAPRIDAADLLARAAVARAQGADVVVLALHWGTEYRHEPDALQQELAPVLAASPDVDLVIGHHAHVVQPVERIGRTWVAYGLGNLVAAHREPAGPKSEGLLVRFTLTEQPGGRFEATDAAYVPLLVTDALPVRILDVTAAVATGATGSATPQRLQEALDRTTAVVESRGAAAAGLHRTG